MGQPQLRALRKRFSLQKKMAAGYLGVLVISVSGVLLGYVVGDYVEYRSVKVSATISESLGHLNHLQVSLLRTHNYRHRLMSHSELSSFQENLNDLMYYQAELKATWLTLQEQVETTTKTYGIENPTLVPIKRFLAENDATFDAYNHELDQLILELQSQQAQPNNDEVTIASLRPAESSANLIDADALSENLKTLIQQTKTQSTAANTSIESADVLRFQISTGFVLASSGVALLLISKLSKAITAPLLSLSQVAQKVTSSQNFTLRAPSLTSDEVGDLADSINQLIASVHSLLQRLEGKTRDLTEQKMSLEKAIAALQDAQLQLIQQEKMSALGKLVAGVAHEINNPVSFIYGNIQYANQYTKDLLLLLSIYKDCYPKPLPEVRGCIEAIDLDFLSNDLPKVMQSMRIGAERIQQIVLSLRTFSRMDEADYKSVNLHDGLDSTLVILEHRFKANPHCPEIRITKSYQDLPLVTCYAGQINQVFMNILANAIDALEESRTTDAKIEISTCLQAEQAIIAISDNGPGIPEDVQDKIFDPFFTTKAVGKGTGLGMAISYQIVVDKHHGQLICDSSVDRGTTFIVRLPLQPIDKNQVTGELSSVST